MAVVIRMMRAGMKKRPFYRVVAADSRRQRDGRFLEILGYYDPMQKPYALKIDEEKVKAWIANGAQPSAQAASLLRTLSIVAARPSKATTSAGESRAKKKVKRRKPRKVTPRKAKNKAARVKKKANPKKSQPKKK